MFICPLSYGVIVVKHPPPWGWGRQLCASGAREADGSDSSAGSADRLCPHDGHLLIVAIPGLPYQLPGRVIHHLNHSYNPAIPGAASRVHMNENRARRTPGILCIKQVGLCASPSSPAFAARQMIGELVTNTGHSDTDRPFPGSPASGSAPAAQYGRSRSRPP